MSQLQFGLALKRIEMLKGKRRNRPYVVVYVGSSASLRDGEPLIAHSRLLEGAQVGVKLTFDGLGLLLLTPRSIDHEETAGGGIAAWHIEVWRSKQWRRDLGQHLARASEESDMNSPLAKVIGQINPALPLIGGALSRVAGGVGKILAGSGDKLIATWAGSCFRDQLEGFAGLEITRRDEDVRVTFIVIGTEGPPGIELKDAV
jgi:hypothetical protein